MNSDLNFDATLWRYCLKSTTGPRQTRRLCRLRYIRDPTPSPPSHFIALRLMPRSHGKPEGAATKLVRVTSSRAIPDRSPSRSRCSPTNVPVRLVASGADNVSVKIPRTNTRRERHRTRSVVCGVATKGRSYWRITLSRPRAAQHRAAPTPSSAALALNRPDDVPLRYP